MTPMMDRQPTGRAVDGQIEEAVQAKTVEELLAELLVEMRRLVYGVSLLVDSDLTETVN